MNISLPKNPLKNFRMSASCNLKAHLKQYLKNYHNCSYNEFKFEFCQPVPLNNNQGSFLVGTSNPSGIINNEHFVLKCSYLNNSMIVHSVTKIPYSCLSIAIQNEGCAIIGSSDRRLYMLDIETFQLSKNYSLPGVGGNICIIRSDPLNSSKFWIQTEGGGDNIITFDTELFEFEYEDIFQLGTADYITSFKFSSLYQKILLVSVVLSSGVSVLYLYDTHLSLLKSYEFNRNDLFSCEHVSKNKILLGFSNSLTTVFDISLNTETNQNIDPYVPLVIDILYNRFSQAFIHCGYEDFTVWMVEDLSQPFCHSIESNNRVESKSFSYPMQIIWLSMNEIITITPHGELNGYTLK